MQPILSILRVLHEADVSFVVVGGVAVVLHGHPRTTVDVDVALDLEDTANVERALTALGGLGLVPRLPVRPEQFADRSVRERWVRERNLQVFSLHHPTDPTREVDIFAEDPIPFAQLHERASLIRINDLPISIASIGDLIEMKRQAGRPQDLADIAALEAIARAEPDRDNAAPKEAGP